MGLDKEQKLTIYNYFIASFDVIYPDGSSYNVPSNFIQHFYIMKHFDGNLFPVFNIRFNLNVNDYYKILENKTKVKFRIRLQKAIMDNINTTVSKMKEDVFNQIFISYINNDTPNYDKNSIKKNNNVRNMGDSPSPEDLSHSMELYLFKDRDINGSKNISNMVLGGLTLTDMLYVLFSNAGLTGNLLMEKLDNGQSYSEIVNPPLPLIKNIDYLENMYDGFYNGSKTLFFDIDYIYFLKKQVGCRVWRTQEYKQTVLIIRSVDNPLKTQNSCEKNTKEKKYYISVDPDMVNINKNSIANDAVDASNIVIVNSKDGSVSNMSANVDKLGSGNKKVIYQNQSNNRVQVAAKNEIESSAMSIIIKCGNIDISAFTPNKEFVIKFEDKTISSNISGKYRLKMSKFEFVPNGSSGFNLNTILEFSK